MSYNYKEGPDHDPVSTREESQEIEVQYDEEKEQPPYPEGGLRAWSVVLGAWCAMIPGMGMLNTLGSLHAWNSTHQLRDYSQSSLGWIYGCYGFFLYLAGGQIGECPKTWMRCNETI